MTSVRPCRVYVPSTSSHWRTRGELAIDLREVSLPSPLSQCPGDRPVDAWIGVVGIQAEQTCDQAHAPGPRDLDVAELAQDQDQGAPDGDVLRPVDLVEHPVRVRAERTHAMDQVAARPRIGAQTEHRPHLPFLFEPQQGRGGIGLTPRQVIPRLLGNERPVPDRRGLGGVIARAAHRLAAGRRNGHGPISLGRQTSSGRAQLVRRQPVEHLRFELRADVPQGGRDESGNVGILVFGGPADQLSIREEETGTVILPELLSESVENTRRGLRLVLPPGPQATTVRLPLIVKDRACDLAVKRLFDERRLRLLLLFVPNTRPSGGPRSHRRLVSPRGR